MNNAIKILIVEDEPTIAQEIAFNLEDHGYEVIGVAHSSDVALDLIYKNKPDLALLDICIQGSRSGIELAEIINEKYNIPFVYLTSFSDEDTVAMAADTDPDGYIVKPFKHDGLAPVIQVALAKYKKRARNGLPTLTQINKKLLQEITKSEYQIITKIWEGMKNQEIADESFVSINTIKSHMKNILRKTNTTSKLDLLSKLRELI